MAYNGVYRDMYGHTTPIKVNLPEAQWKTKLNMKQTKTWNPG